MVATKSTPDWKHVADVLARELQRWGWGDFHYGAQPQEQSVCDALAVYEAALRTEQPMPVTWWEKLLDGIAEAPITPEQRRVVLDLADSFRKSTDES